MLSFLPLEWMTATLLLVLAFMPSSSAVLKGASVSCSELKNRSQAHVHLAVTPNVFVAAQGVTMGTPARLAISAPGSTRESVQELSTASTRSWVISVCMLFTVVFGL